jgi:hypothetical protein
MNWGDLLDFGAGPAATGGTVFGGGGVMRRIVGVGAGVHTDLMLSLAGSVSIYVALYGLDMDDVMCGTQELSRPEELRSGIELAVSSGGHNEQAVHDRCQLAIVQFGASRYRSRKMPRIRMRTL